MIALVGFLSVKTPFPETPTEVTRSRVHNAPRQKPAGTAHQT
jgi:hypothetical protein